MERTIITRAPEGFSTISPYLMVDSVEKELDFLTNVFGAKFREPLKTPDGDIVHVVGFISEVAVMIGKTRPGLPLVTSMNYVFTDDVDETYNKALSLGAKSIMAPVDQFYGFRECGILDPQDNQWWIAKKFEHVNPEDIIRKIDEMSREE